MSTVRENTPLTAVTLTLYENITFTGARMACAIVFYRADTAEGWQRMRFARFERMPVVGECVVLDDVWYRVNDVAQAPVSRRRKGWRGSRVFATRVESIDGVR